MGRANPAIIESVTVDAYGSIQPQNLANGCTLTHKPLHTTMDKSLLRAIGKGITDQVSDSIHKTMVRRSWSKDSTSPLSGAELSLKSQSARRRSKVAIHYNPSRCYQTSREIDKDSGGGGCSQIRQEDIHRNRTGWNHQNNGWTYQDQGTDIMKI